MAADHKGQEGKGFELPEWETTARHRGGKGASNGTGGGDIINGILAAFDRFVPPHRKYCGLRRQFACIVLVAVSLVLLALILGLAIGLSEQTRAQHKSLPLGSAQFTGDLTYYEPGLGACGVTSSNSDDIVSISHFTFDAVSKGSDPNANPLCGHKLRALRGGNSVDLTVVDRCVGCQPKDLDVSISVFKRLADPDLGRVELTWAWLPPIPIT